MNKADLINHVSTSTGLSKSQASDAIKAFMDAVESTLVQGKRLTLVGFGTFETANRQARIGRNPKTGVEISIPAKRIAKFKAGAKLLSKVNS